MTARSAGYNFFHEEELDYILGMPPRTWSNVQRDIALKHFDRQRGNVAAQQQDVKFLRSFGLLHDVNSASKTVAAIISTGNVSRDNAVILPEGWDFRNYDANPAVLWNHGRDGELPIGRTTNRNAEAGRLIATAQLDAEDAFAMRIFDKVKRGFLSATSVRWHPIEWEWRRRRDVASALFGGRQEGEGEDKVLVFMRQELLEWSFVQVGADPGGLVLRDAAGDPVDVRAFPDATPSARPSPHRELRLVPSRQGGNGYLKRQLDQLDGAEWWGLAEVGELSPDSYQTIIAAAGRGENVRPLVGKALEDLGDARHRLGATV